MWGVRCSFVRPTRSTEVGLHRSSSAFSSCTQFPCVALAVHRQKDQQRFSVESAHVGCPRLMSYTVDHQVFLPRVSDAGRSANASPSCIISPSQYSSQAAGRWTLRRGMLELRHTQFGYSSEPFPRSYRMRELCNTGVRRQVDKSGSGRVCASLWSNYQMS